MFSKFPAITVLWVGNIRLVLPSSYFHVRCFSYIKFPATSTFQDIDHVFRIAVKKRRYSQENSLFLPKVKPRQDLMNPCLWYLQPRQLYSPDCFCLFFFTRENLERINNLRRDLGCRVPIITRLFLKTFFIVSPWTSLKMFLMNFLG